MVERERSGDLRKRFYKRLRSSLLVLFFMFLTLSQLPLPSLYAGEWYEGGSLHQTSVRRWVNASSTNRLATSADWFLSMTKKSNKVLQKELEAMDKADYDASLKYYATRLERCISEKVEKKTVRAEDKISDYADKCYQILHGDD